MSGHRKKPQKIRCAIYTRKSSEEGLDQDFNSLDAQREASEAYISSQKHEGWELVPTAYDDGGFSGGTMERPALKRLLADIEAGLVDIIVVYKVDRLSRALGDFAKMVDIFDKHKVSFVSVTQSFNTTTSMGRLTLNVLLSFAQFEREVTGERIRDKIAASKKKGLWMGGPLPLGYDVVNRELIINEDEAKIIRTIYQSYVDLPKHTPLHQLLDALTAKGYKNKSYTSRRGNKTIGKDFTLTQLYRILSNSLYNGKIKHKEKVYEGMHKAIIADDLWQQVQQQIDRKQFVRHPSKTAEQPKLIGKIFDYHGNRLGPTYSYKYSASGRYKMRYYINNEIKKTGKTVSEFKRIRAEMIDEVVKVETATLIEQLIEGIANSENAVLASALLASLKHLQKEPATFLDKITLYPKHMDMALAVDIDSASLSSESLDEITHILRAYDAKISLSREGKLMISLSIRAQYKRTGNQLHIITEQGKLAKANISARHRYAEDKSFVFIAKAFHWSKQMQAGIYRSIPDIINRTHHNREYVKKSLNQRFLSPKVIAAITSNNTSAQIPVEQMIQCRHWRWDQQEQQLLSHSS